MKKNTKDALWDALWTIGGSVAAVVFLGACFGQPDLPGPVVYVRVGEGSGLTVLTESTRWTPEDLRWVERGIIQWRRLGFDVRGLDEPIDTTLPPEDVIIIDIYRDADFPSVNGKVFGGLSDRAARKTFINAVLADFGLMGTVTHELGHQLLNTSEHLPADAHGVMTPSSNSWSLTEDDFNFACRVAKRCDRF